MNGSSKYRTYFITGFRFLIVMIGLIMSVQSCINDSNVVEDVSVRAHKKMLVLGYGTEKGESSKGTEMLARQFAIASLGDQISGNRFSFAASGDKIDFMTDSKADIPGMREYDKKIKQIGNQYLVFYIVGSEIDIEYPLQFGIYDKSYSESGDNITAVISDMKFKAVKEAASERFLSKIPKKLTGRLFLTSLKADSPDDNTAFRVDATISVLFDSVIR